MAPCRRFIRKASRRVSGTHGKLATSSLATGPAIGSPDQRGRSRMRRREFIAGLGAAASLVVVRSQQGDRLRRIGVLMGGNENDPEPKARHSAFTQGLADFGWTDGRNVRMDLRWGGGDTNRMRALAQELVGLQPDIILAGGNVATAALQRETRTIPIVFVIGVDPVASGIVPRLNQPGGNITGFAIYEASLGGKW